MTADYHTQARGEIEAWRSRKPSAVEGFAGRVLGAVARPFTWVVENTAPKSVRQTTERAVMGALEALRDASRWTYSDQTILKAAKKRGLAVESIIDLRQAPLKDVDRLARSCFTSNKIIAAVEGAGCGLGGLVLIAADIPLLFGVALRSTQQIGTCYGFEMDDPAMAPIVYQVFNAAAAGSSGMKTAALADMHVAAAAFGKNWTYAKVAEVSQTGTFAQLLKKSTERLPQQISKHVTKSKLSQWIPFFGSAVGAGFNYWFLANVTTSAYMLFRELRLSLEGNDETRELDSSA